MNSEEKTTLPTTSPEQVKSEPEAKASESSIEVASTAKVAVAKAKKIKRELTPIQKTTRKVVSIGSIVGILVFLGIFRGPIIDSLFTRDVVVRNIGFTFSTEDNHFISEESGPTGDFTVTFLCPGGKSITARVDRSFPRMFGEQRRETFGNIKSAALLSKEQGEKTITIKVSGVETTIPRMYPVLKSVK